jgi:1-acyl-sn-glycerol-3-phosphate acyltransferase
MDTAEAQSAIETKRRGSLFTRLRSYCFFVPIVYLCTGVLGVIALLCSLFDREGRLQHRIARVWARSILRVVGIRVEVRGKERLTPSQPVVYAANHLSAVDIPVLYAELPGQFRIMAKKQLFRYPFLGWYLSRSGQIPIVLGDAHASLRSLNRACDALRKGMPLAVFPEGGRSPSGELQEFLGGAFYVAIRAQISRTSRNCATGIRRADTDGGLAPARRRRIIGARPAADRGDVRFPRPIGGGGDG